MSLRDIMRADAANLCDLVADMAETGTYLPMGATVAIAVNLVAGDANPTPTGEMLVGQDARMQVVISTDSLAALILLALGTARDPAQGDLVTLEDGTIWAVEAWQRDIGGGTTLSVRRQTTGFIGRGYGGVA